MSTIRLGSKSEDVKTLQTYLQNIGYEIGIDGIFGQKTNEAVRDFQQKNELTVDGIVGPATWEKIKSSINSKEKQINKILKFGSKGEEVIALQKLLKELGYEIIVDGIFGQKTREAVINFQQKNDLEDDGIVGTNTYKKIQTNLIKNNQLNEEDNMNTPKNQSKETVRLGSKSEEVKILQTYLKNIGYEIGIDGIFGQKTDEAVRDFQRKNELAVDGIVGPATWNKLDPNVTFNNGLSEEDYIRASKELGVEVSIIKAVKEVESSGKGIQNGVPTMLFEGHIFWSELKKNKIDPNKYINGNEDILYPKWDRKHYCKNNSGEMERLKKAIKINEECAYSSASYGLFQIMGFNYKACGYSSAKQFYESMCISEGNQLDAFIKFIKYNKYNIYLEKKDWSGFAKRYNGPGYAQNKYDIKLKQAYERYKAK